MKKWVMIFLTIILICTVVIVIANSYFSKTITNDDISDGKRVITDLFAAVNNEDVKGANGTIGRYLAGRFNETNIKGWKPKLTSIEYIKDDKFRLPPHSYKSNYGHDPFQSMSFRVTYFNNIDQKKYKQYFILVKETKNAKWKIHDWGLP
ncbi:MAG: DUF4829 domain-containing protein [Candidatus Margulisbacteria bacterium]|nr:DUF4829 domain-containing protein [Candidatus Margulisiibacteriota bacterium]